ncbi:helix-turn-helix domain-containing protein [Brachybacterium saurashtrense]|uniref:Transcriptional regulator n=1 Tax=Brachybacterium saurashtrense TaxID=556288 RepID=A0A345YM89_9MICO|nr:helix-turn-helix domain-containing protein [Brachybacterium saurashtrense]AXK45041.1 transcriptional regulator [Brachybacterium saurashtrense]RRR21725.1 transcriptional regulator [Brachybacterium saurashtrense]
MTHHLDPAAEIGAAIRRARKEAELTQQQLGELSGVSDRTLRDIESGAGSPALRSVLTVLTVLGLHVTVTP